MTDPVPSRRRDAPDTALRLPDFLILGEIVGMDDRVVLVGGQSRLAPALAARVRPYVQTLFLAAWLILLLGGWLAALYTVGDAGLRLSGRAESASHGLRVVSIALAVVAVTLVAWVPYLGGLFMVLLFLLGLGALSMRLWRAYPGMAGSAGH